MSSAVDLANRALSKIGTQKTIASFQDPTPAATQCNLWYDVIRRSLLRTAPWAFARKQLALTQTGDAVPDNTAPYPWLFQYAYPSDCLKFRYVLAPQPVVVAGTVPNVSDFPLAPWCRPSRNNRYILNTTFDADNNPSQQLVTNVCNAIGVYTYDCQVPDMFDPLFEQALVSALAVELIMPLSGSASLIGPLKQDCIDKINQARAASANEAITKTDHTPDWIKTREVGGGYWGNPEGGFLEGWGQWTCGWDDMSWSM